MEERRCPKCESPIAAENKFCPSCGAKQPREPEQPTLPPVKRKRLEGGLLVEILVIVGFVALGTLAVYSLVSSVSGGDWHALFEKVTVAGAVAPIPEPAAPAPKSATPAQSTRPDEKSEQPKQPGTTLSDLLELPPAAPANAYIALKQGVTARRNNGTISFTCTLENISDIVCTSAGIEVGLYDAASNFIGSCSSWVHRDIQPGEMLELNFENRDNRDAYAFCVTKIGGGVIEKNEETLVPQQSEVLLGAITITTDEIALAQGDSPYRWIEQQDGKKFIVTGPVSQVMRGENDNMWVVKIGNGQSACYVTFLHPDAECVDRMNQLIPDTEACMSGVCVALNLDQPRFILADGAFEE